MQTRAPAAFFLLAMLVLAGLPGGGAALQDVEADVSTSTFTFNGGSEGWTVTGGSQTPADNWHRQSVGGDPAFYAGHVVGGAPTYGANASTMLTSPWIDLRGAALERLLFDLRGSSEDGVDILTLEVRPEFPSNAAWTALRTFTGPARAGAFSTVNVTADLAPFSFTEDQRFRLRFSFASDGANEVGEGWFVDDILIVYRDYVFDDIITLFADGFSTGGVWTEDPATGNDRWQRINDGGDVAYFAGNVSGAGQPNGYRDGTSTTITSPVIDTDGARVRAIQFTLRGGSSPPFDDPTGVLGMILGGDLLLVEASYAGGPFVEEAVFSGTDLQGMVAGTGVSFQIRNLEQFALLQARQSGATLQLRFSFVTDGVPLEDLCISSPPDPTDDPAAFVLCMLVDSFEGWFLDDVIVQAFDTAGAPVPGAAILPFDFPETEASIESVDLITDRNRFIGFDLDETQTNIDRQAQGDPAFPAFESARVFIEHSSGEALELALQRSTGADGHVHWTHAMPVSEPDFLLGTNAVRFSAVFADGTGAEESVGRSLIAQGNDDGDPRLSMAAESPQVVGTAGLVRVIPEDVLLREVRYRLPGMDTGQPIGQPYILGPGPFQEGSQVVTFTATDRAGNSASIQHTVIKDTTDPVVELDMPERLFQGLEATIQVNVTDTTATKVVARINETVAERILPPGGGTATFRFTPDALGMRVFELSVRDAAANRHSFSQQIEYEQVETDLRIASLSASDGPFLPGDSITFMATVEQEDGVLVGDAFVPIPANLTFRAQDGTATHFELRVPGTGDTDVSFSTSNLAAGQHTVTATLETADHIVELDPSDDSATIDVEVFVGRVDHHDASYYIRVSEVFGLPLVAVDVGSGTTYALSVPDPETGNKYYFTVGDEELYWDPLMPITVIGEADSEDTPGPAPLAVLVLVGVAAALRRRP